MDLYGKDKGNISLPQRLQTINFEETKFKDDIINTQKSFYNLKIAEINKKIQRYLCKITMIVILHHVCGSIYIYLVSILLFIPSSFLLVILVINMRSLIIIICCIS